MGGSGLTGNPNDLALMLNLIIPIAGALVFIARGVERAGGRRRRCCSAIAGVIVTFSRAGFLTLAAIVRACSLAVLARRQGAGRRAGLLLLALCAPPLLPAGYVDRLSTITDIEADETGSAQGRWQDFKVAADVVAENPIVGVGIGQDVLALNEERGRTTWRSVHNAYLQYARRSRASRAAALRLAAPDVLPQRARGGAARRAATRRCAIWRILAAGVQIVARRLRRRRAAFIRSPTSSTSSASPGWPSRSRTRAAPRVGPDARPRDGSAAS